jgi:ribosomal protein S18 acetylase RimI-like enzyme
MIRVRPAYHTDFEAAAEIMRDLMARHHHWQPDEYRPTFLGLTAAIFQTWLERPDELHLVAELDGRIAGYAAASRWAGQDSALAYARRSVFVFNIGVAAEQRCKGIGRALIAAVEDWARDFNAEYVGLHVLPANDEAKIFYAKLGYDVTGEHRSKTLRRVTRMSGRS